MQCQKCSQTYSSLKPKQPRILINCGHTFCQECIVSFNHFSNNHLVKVECFQCKTITEVTNINQLPVNIAIQKLFKQSSNKSATINQCVNHKKVIEAYCSDDQNLLCIDCIVGGTKTEDGIVTHKGHELLNITQALIQLQSEAQNKQKVIDGQYAQWLKEVQKQVDYKKSELDQAKETHQKQLTEYFTFLRSAIDKQEEEQNKVISENYQTFNQKLTNVKDRMKYFKLLQQDYRVLNERSAAILQQDTIQFIRDFPELKSVGEKIDQYYESESTIEAQEILNSDLDDIFKKLKPEELLKHIRQKVLDNFSKNKSIPRQMTMVPSRSSLRKSYDPILSDRKDTKPKLDDHPLQVELVTGSISRERQYLTTNSINQNLIKKSTSTRQFMVTNQKTYQNKLSNMATFSKYLTKKHENTPFSTFKSKNCSPRGLSINRQKKNVKVASISSKIKNENINTTSSGHNKSVNKHIEASVNLCEEKQRITLGEDDNKSKVFTPLCGFKKAQRLNPKQMLDHSSSMSLISSSSRRYPGHREILSPVAKKSNKFCKQQTKAKNYLNNGKKLIGKSPKAFKGKAGVFSSFEETIQTNKLSQYEFRESSTQEDNLKNSQELMYDKTLEGQCKQECFDYQMSIKRNPFKDMDIINTQSSNNFEKCKPIQRTDPQQVNHKILEDDTQSDDSMCQYPSFNQFYDDYVSKCSSTVSEQNARFREENGKYFIVKENIFKTEEVEVEGIKIKQVLKMK